MSIEQTALGKRLKEARLSCGMTQEAAAVALRLPRTAMVHIEAGTRALSATELVRLAKLYRRPISEFFADEIVDTAEQEDPQDVLFRMDGLHRDQRIMQEVSRCADLCREGALLESLLGRSLRTGPPVYKLPEARSAIEAVRQGSSVADGERKRLGLGDAPIRNITDLVANQGIWAASTCLPDVMSGLFLRHSSIGMFILVNRTHCYQRQRFSFAHEYAHALLDRPRTAIASTNKNVHEHAETRANAFAASFLMPASGVRVFLEFLDKGAPSRHAYYVYDVAGGREIEVQGRAMPGSQKITYQDVASLAHYFGVSYQAAVFRLQDLGIIRQPDRESLINQTDLGKQYGEFLDIHSRFGDARQGSRTRRCQETDRELVSQIVYLAIEAFRRAVISEKKLLELGRKLEMPGAKLLKLAQAAT